MLSLVACDDVRILVDRHHLLNDRPVPYLYLPVRGVPGLLEPHRSAGGRVSILTVLINNLNVLNHTPFYFDGSLLLFSKISVAHSAKFSKNKPLECKRNHKKYH